MPPAGRASITRSSRLPVDVSLNTAGACPVNTRTLPGTIVAPSGSSAVTCTSRSVDRAGPPAAANSTR